MITPLPASASGRASRETRDDAFGAAALVRAEGAPARRAVSAVPLAGRYIVDFCAPAVRLVVEVDGAYHRERQPRRRTGLFDGFLCQGSCP
jgi:hypothetical protein